jgi:putative nucleotidyltransferase with HDIG domain
MSILDKTPESAKTKRVKYAVGGIESLAELPAVAAQAVSALCQTPFSPATLAAVVGTSPALAARVLFLAWQQGIDPADRGFSIERILEKIPSDVVRDGILSVDVYAKEDAEDSRGAPSRQDLVVHSLAVAFGARRIAEASPLQIDPDLAFLAGLLHDVGKLAVQQVMPKGFDRIVQQARSSEQAGHIQEREDLGTDHAALGRLLARKWHFPPPIQTAIWLHHSPAAAASRPDGGRLAQLVTVADAVARTAGIGTSGSYDRPEVTAQMAEYFELDPAALQAITARLPEVVRTATARPEWQDPDPWPRLSQATREAALQLSRKLTQLTADQGKLQSASGQMTFLRDFLGAIPCHLTAVDLAEDLARRWQRFYQTGKVCVLLASPEDEEAPDVAVVEGLGASRKLLLDGPDAVAWEPAVRGKEFGVYAPGPFLEELAEQTATAWDPRRTRWVPLSFDRRTFGMVIFELNYPADADRFVDHFRVTAQGAAAGLYLMMSRQRHEQIAEDLAGLLAEAPDTETQDGEIDLGAALVEVAAGFAHELNNPLAVISGRAQLLAEGQVDESTRRSLHQIQDQARQISALVEGLMSYAEPPAPRKAPTPVGQILEEAVDLARQRLGGEALDLQIETAPDAAMVFVDSAQVATAVSNVLVNAFESYADTRGPVEVRIERAASGEYAAIRVRDNGCGMEAETLRKATLPFFSARPAGRKRGLGLAFADRLIRLNDGRLEIASEPGAGTTVTFELPLRDS